MKAVIAVFLYFLSIDSHGRTCSKDALNVVYVSGAQSRVEMLYIDIGEIKKAIHESGKVLDQKGYEITPIYADVGRDIAAIAYELYRFLKDNAQLPARILARIIRDYIFSKSIESFVSRYGKDTLIMLDLEMEFLLAKRGIVVSEETKKQVFSLIDTSLSNENKISVLSHGIASWATNKAIIDVARKYGRENDKLKLVHNFIISPPATFPESPIKLTPFSYVSNQQDLSQVWARTTGDDPSISPNMLFAETQFEARNSFFLNDLVKTYLSHLKVRKIGRNEPPKKARLAFVDFLIEGLDDLRANSINCCNGRFGEMWVNHRTCPAGIEACDGGFVEEGIHIVDPNKLEVAPTSSLCRHDNSTPYLSGSIQVDGNVSLGAGVKINGPSSNSKRITLGKIGHELKIGTSTEIQSNDNLSIGGTITINTSKITGNGSIDGSLTPDGLAYPFSNGIANAEISGNSEIKGNYVLSGKVKNAKIDGLVQHINRWPIVAPGLSYTYVSPSGSVDSSSLTGLVIVDGKVANNVEMIGRQIGLADDGIVIQVNAIVSGPGTKLDGSVRVGETWVDDGPQPTVIGKNTIIKGNRYYSNIWIPSTSAIRIFADSTLEQSELEGDMWLFNSIVKGNSVITSCDNTSYWFSTFDNTKFYGPYPGSHTSQDYTDLSWGTSDWAQHPNCPPAGRKSDQKIIGTPRKSLADTYSEFREKYPIPDSCEVFGCAQ